MSIPTLPWLIPGFDHIGDGQSGNYIIGSGAFDSVSNVARVQIVTVDGIRRLRINENSGSPSARMTIPSVTEIVFGFLGRWNSGGIATPWIGFYSGGTREITLDVLSDGTLRLRRGTTTIDSDASHDYQDGTDRYVELAYKVHQTAGEYEVRVNGATVMQASGVDTTVTGDPIDQFRMEGDNTFTSGEYVDMTHAYFKQWEDVDTPGFYGTIIGHLRDPTADVAVEFTATPGAGENREEVDETPLDDDTTYVETSDVGDVDEYEVGDSPAGVQAILAVVRGTVSVAPSGGAPNIEHGVKRGASEAYGTARALAASYGTHVTPFFTQPNGQPWSKAAADDITTLDRSA